MRERLARTCSRIARGEATARRPGGARRACPRPRSRPRCKAVSDEYGARLRVTGVGRDPLLLPPAACRSRYRGFGPALAPRLEGLQEGRPRRSRPSSSRPGSSSCSWATSSSSSPSPCSRSWRPPWPSHVRGSRGPATGAAAAAAGRLLARRPASSSSIVRIWFYSELFKRPERRPRAASSACASPRTRRPLHKAVFSFVFGDGDPNALLGRDRRRRRSSPSSRPTRASSPCRGVHGPHRPAARARPRTLINRYLYEFEGSPEVTDGGVDLLFLPRPPAAQGQERDRSFGGSAPLEAPASRPSRRIPKKANLWFCRHQRGRTCVFGGYFLSQALNAPDPRAALLGRSRRSRGHDARLGRFLHSSSTSSSASSRVAASPVDGRTAWGLGARARRLRGPLLPGAGYPSGRSGWPGRTSEITRREPPPNLRHRAGSWDGPEPGRIPRPFRPPTKRRGPRTDPPRRKVVERVGRPGRTGDPGAGRHLVLPRDWSRSQADVEAARSGARIRGLRPGRRRLRLGKPVRDLNARRSTMANSGRAARPRPRTTASGAGQSSWPWLSAASFSTLGHLRQARLRRGLLAPRRPWPGASPARR
ncbi:MAG: hypothetical protein MZV63_57460 [Marinilabiliales bacterium]|nr:hypothetical protein [Marinilabiliales bacterium]